MQDAIAVFDPANEKAAQAFSDIEPFLATKGITLQPITPKELPTMHLEARRDYADAEMIIVLGGDGTILRSARLAEMLNAPILGINFGHLGFLANPCEGDVWDMAAEAIYGEGAAERRTNLSVEVTNGDGISQTCFALNEVVLRSATGHIIDFDLRIGGADVANMRGDGIVVASATGSTAYALSAGGPLVSPRFDGLVVVPLAPHTLTSRAICTEPGELVEIEVAQGGSDIAVFMDGDKCQVMGGVSKVTARTGDTPTTLIRLDKEGFYKRIANVFF